MSTSTGSLSFKIRRGDELRRFGLDGTSPTFAALASTVRSVFVMRPNEPVAFKYTDADGDAITVTSDIELVEALRLQAGIVRFELVAPKPAAKPAAIAAKAPAAADLKPAAAKPAPPPAAAKKPAAKAPASPIAVAPTAGAAALIPIPSLAVLPTTIVAAPPAHLEESAATKTNPEEAPMGKGMLWGRFVRDVTIPDGTVVQPNEAFTKTWRFRNDLDKPWPVGTRLLFVGKNSDRLGAPDEVPVPHQLPAGQEADVSVPLVAPAAAGRYTGYFRLAGPDGKKFGQRVWVMVTVAGAGSSDDENAEPMPAPEQLAKWRPQLEVLAQLNFNNLAMNIRLLRKFDGSLEQVVTVLMRRKNMAAKRAAKAAAQTTQPALAPAPAPAGAPAIASPMLAPQAAAALPMPPKSEHPSERVE